MANFQFFLLSLLLIGLSNSLTSGSKKQCPNIIPNVNRMTRGVDITTLDLFGVVNDGFRGKLFEFTCNMPRKWSYDGLVYDRPDQLTSVDTISKSNELNTKIFINVNDYKKTILETLGFRHESPIYGALSASQAYKEVQENYFAKNKSVADVTLTVPTTIDDLSLRTAKLNVYFTNYFINKPNPPKYEQDSTLYDSFVQDFGTHYFTRAIFGGRLLLRTEIAQKYMNENSDCTIRENLKASFNFWFNFKGSKNTSNEFQRSKKEMIISYFGGQWYWTRTLDEWVQTLHRDPVLMGGVLEPIENLIPNVNFKTEVTKAIKVHRLRAYIGELKRTLQLGEIVLKQDEMDMIGWIESVLDSKNLTQFQQMITDLDVIFLGIRSSYGACTKSSTQVSSSPTITISTPQTTLSPIANCCATKAFVLIQSIMWLFVLRILLFSNFM